jgi:ABC-2 type transport system ATP-binding protein
VTPAISIQNLGKTYASGFTALKDVSLDIRRGEIFALLGPNGAGKTTLIGITCGIVRPTAGRETVWSALRFSRGLFGKPPNPDYLEKLLRELSLWEKRNDKIMTLSGGMKRRVLIAKALSHEPDILFLDEPTAGVDVELRRDMWTMVAGLRERGVTIILTTHYIEEAEQMADRIGVINRGELLLVEDKSTLMGRLGKKQLLLSLQTPLAAIPPSLADLGLELTANGEQIAYTFDSQAERSGIATLIRRLQDEGISFRDLHTRESSLEDIFVDLVRAPAGAAR